MLGEQSLNLSSKSSVSLRRTVLRQPAGRFCTMFRLALYLPVLLFSCAEGLQTAVALLATGSLLTGADALNIAITGTSQGIGLDAAKRLVAAGHNVYHLNRNGARSAEAAQQAGGGVPMVCDLASLASVRAFADELSTKPLDVLA